MRWILAFAVAAAGCGGGGGGGDAAIADTGVIDSAADGATCDPTSDAIQCSGAGICAPSRACSAARPCPDGLVGIARQTIAEPLFVPTCHTTATNRAAFDDGAARTWTDAVTGEARAACVFRPAGLGPTSKRPLVVFVHGSGGTASGIYDVTSLRAKAVGYDLSGDGARPGFVLAADQGRNLVTPNGNPPGPRHDVYYRGADNPDFRNLDRLIDELVGEGGVDRARIYLMGWSNGAFFAQAYALARHAVATPGGNNVAAAVAFDGADPLQRPTAPSAGCDAPAPRVSVPIMLIHRACSIIPCDTAQALAMAQPPGYDVAAWEQRLITVIGARDVTNVIVNGQGQRVLACTAAAACGNGLATINHIRWPDGVADGSGIDHEPAMLDYLRDHPLP